MRPARSVEQRFMPEMLEDVDGKKRGVERIHIPRNGTQSFRAQAEHHLGLSICAQGSAQPVRNRDREAAVWIAQFGAADRELQEVHRGRADEAGDKSVGGLVVDLKRGSSLLNDAV